MKSSVKQNLALLAPALAWLVFVAAYHPSQLSLLEVSLHFLFFLYFGILAALAGAITMAGAITAAVIGTQISAVNNYSILPLIIFFITGTLFSRLPNAVRSDAKSGKPRDAIQVLANGLPAFAICTAGSLFHINAESLYLVSVAVACADTWSSELGSRFGKKPVDIQSLKPVPAGLSGGVTTMGFICGLAGAALVATFAENIQQAIIITVGGFAGTLLDSFLGSRYQIAFSGESGLPADSGAGKPLKGVQWVTNDVVNLLSNTLVVAMAALLLL